MKEDIFGKGWRHAWPQHERQKPNRPNRPGEEAPRWEQGRAFAGEEAQDGPDADQKVESGGMAYYGRYASGTLTFIEV